VSGGWQLPSLPKRLCPNADWGSLESLKMMINEMMAKATSNSFGAYRCNR
jgi:hypothetical protein